MDGFLNGWLPFKVSTGVFTLLRVHRPGRPESLFCEAFISGQPDQGEVRVKHTAAALNCDDVYPSHRSDPVNAAAGS